MSRRKKLRILGLAAVVVLLGIGATAYSMWPKVEAIPEQLDAIDPDVSIAELELEAQGPLEGVRLGDLSGNKVFLLIEGKESMTTGEGKQLRRAMLRWDMPADVVGFSVGDAPGGAALMRNKIERQFVGPMRGELKWPIYLDFGGDITEAFSLPKGHLGLVILDEAGEVVLRHAGDADAQTIEEIRMALGASEPQAGPPAPEFAIGELDNQACAGHACVLVFLDRKVARSEIPGLEEGGFEGDMEDAFAQLEQPSIRLARVLAGDWKAKEDERLRGVVVGEAEGWAVDGWAFVPEAEAARQALEIGEQAAMVIIDKDGHLAFAETGRIPFWKLTVAADLLGIEPDSYRGGRRE